MTLQEAIETIEHQKKYITGNPILVEAYETIINEAKPMNQCDVCCNRHDIYAIEEPFESDCGINLYTVCCPSAKLRLQVAAYTENDAINTFRSCEKDRYMILEKR